MTGFGSRPRTATQTLGGQILISHLDGLYRFAFRLSGNPHDAEDLVQGLFTKLLSQLDHVVTLERPGPWLARSLYNHFIDTTRRRSVAPTHLVDGHAHATHLDDIQDELGESPEEFAERALTHQHLAEALMRLTPELRAVVVWHDIEGYTLEELAQVQTDVPVGTFKSRLHRARRQLRLLLIERFPQRVRE